MSLIVRNLKAERSVKILDSAKMFFVVFDVARLRGCSPPAAPRPSADSDLDYLSNTGC